MRLERDELVPRLPNGDDPLWARVVSLQLAPQVRDVRIARPCVAYVRRTPEMLHGSAVA